MVLLLKSKKKKSLKSFFNYDLNVILQVVRLAFDIHTSETAGDILVFLTGTE